MNPIGPVQPSRLSRRDWFSKSRNSASFGRGVRWFLVSTRSIDWSVAMSLPIGLMSSLLLIFVPLFLASQPDSQSVRAGLVLLAAWVIGWLMQALVAQIWLHRLRHEIVTLTIGGVWATVGVDTRSDRPPDSQDAESGMTGSASGPGSVASSRNAAGRTIGLWLSILSMLVFAALACLVFDSSPALARSGDAIGDRPWVAAGWMLGLQAIWQWMPVPQSLGRVGWSILVGWFSSTRPTTLGNHDLFNGSNRSKESARSDWDRIDHHAPDGPMGAPGPLDWADRRDGEIGPHAVMATRRVRWWMIGFALATLVGGVLAIQLAGISTQSGGRPMPVFAGVVLLSMWMFASSRNEDLFAIQLTLSENGETGRFQKYLHPIAAWNRLKLIKSQRDQTIQLRAAVVREQSEANDASRVDEILLRLHEKGADQLTSEEKALLTRVSEAIRRQRQRDQSAGPRPPRD